MLVSGSAPLQVWCSHIPSRETTTDWSSTDDCRCRRSRHHNSGRPNVDRRPSNSAYDMTRPSECVDCKLSTTSFIFGVSKPTLPDSRMTWGYIASPIFEHPHTFIKGYVLKSNGFTLFAWRMLCSAHTSADNYVPNCVANSCPKELTLQIEWANCETNVQKIFKVGFGYLLIASAAYA